MEDRLDYDWVAHWRELVEARAAQVSRAGSGRQAFWSADRARRFAASMGGQADPFLQWLEPWLQPGRTLIDVGAGTGRHIAPLADRLEWVTAVEPSDAMRAHIPARDNTTVIASTWEDAAAAPADLVICVHVLYPIADPVPFVAKLSEHARERVFIVMRDSPHAHPAELMAPPGRVREPRLRDLFLLLRQIGVAPDVSMFAYPAFQRFESLEAAVADCRGRLGQLWDEEAGRQWLVSHLQADQDGSLVYRGGEVTSGVLHWRPT